MDSLNIKASILSLLSDNGPDLDNIVHFTLIIQ
jgi:hypothetical protein